LGQCRCDKERAVSANRGINPIPSAAGALWQLVLRNGLRVPVSKSFRGQVKEAGWLGG
jgi:hypothetical protein